MRGAKELTVLITYSVLDILHTLHIFTLYYILYLIKFLQNY